MNEAELSRRDLVMFSLGEHICELTIEFTCFSKSLWATPPTFLFLNEVPRFLTINLMVHIPGVRLYISNQIILIELPLLINISFDFSPLSFKFRSYICL